MTKPLLRWIGIGVLVGALLAGTGLWPAVPLTSHAQGSNWTVNVFNNRDLVAPAIWTGISPNVNYTWGAGAPVINGVPTGAPVDNFSVRFSISAFFTAGNYRFTVQFDDGARLQVDGLLLINEWASPGGLRTVQADYNFVADGTHNITVEMYDSVGDATIIANWALAVGPLPTPITGGGGPPWNAEFFASPDLSGAAVFTTTYPPSGINQNWGTGSPSGSVPADNFTARFTRNLTVPTDIPEAYYTFYIRADDNFRFYVDVSLILDRWDVFSGTELQTVGVALLPGPHTLKLEYREQSADAALFFTWTPPNAQNPVLAPDGAAVPAGTPVPGATPGAAPGAAPPPPPPSGVRGMVMGNLRLRSGPSTRAAKIGLMPWGTQVDILGRDAGQDWYQVNFNGLIGWAYAPWIKVTQGSSEALPYTDGTQPVFAPPPTTGVIAQAFGNMRIRSGPGFQFPKISKAVWGTRVQVLGRSTDGRWFKVQHGDVVGWSYATWFRVVQGDITTVPRVDQ